MMIDTRCIASVTEANQNFSKVARMADEYGAAIILRNNTPKYLLIEFGSVEKSGEFLPDEDFRAVSKAIMRENREAMEVLAK